MALVSRYKAWMFELEMYDAILSSAKYNSFVAQGNIENVQKWSCLMMQISKW